ncbi:hypothetical protein BJ322DRAFT_1025522 [Thelephora terrestris]|uniref:Uncharacterized protein n=1 Tax=Thelephora terrestris TaxID=56493 RepID=A0A9P6H370_9AGAM|nr:hypothetical protein BJ322DRAFT_1025522 [Thelephora terrestris]
MSGIRKPQNVNRGSPSDLLLGREYLRLLLQFAGNLLLLGGTQAWERSDGLTTFLNWKTYASAGPSRRSSSAGARTPPVTPSMRGLSPMTRLFPIAEAGFGSDQTTESARRAWDPHHRDAFVERRVKIRGCLDLAAVLSTVPDYYRATLTTIGSDLMVLLDEIDVLTRKAKKYDGMKGRGEFPFHYNSVKLPSVQYSKGSKGLFNEHFSLPAKDAVAQAKKSMFDAEILFVSKQLNALNDQIREGAILQVAWSALQRRYEERPKSTQYRVKIPTPADNADWPTELTADMLEVSDVDDLKEELRALQVDLPVYVQKFTDLKMEAIERVHGKKKDKAEEKRTVDVAMEDVASTSTTEAQQAINKEFILTLFI